MSDEHRVKHLQERLRKIEDHRARLRAELNEIMRRAIEVEHIAPPPGAEGYGELLAHYTKARLTQILESHWRVHHMAVIEHLEVYSQPELVNLVLAVKGLEGSYNPPGKTPSKTAAKRSGGRKHVWRE